MPVSIKREIAKNKRQLEQQSMYERRLRQSGNDERPVAKVAARERSAPGSQAQECAKGVIDQFRRVSVGHRRIAERGLMAVVVAVKKTKNGDVQRGRTKNVTEMEWKTSAQQRSNMSIMRQEEHLSRWFRYEKNRCEALALSGHYCMLSKVAKALHGDCMCFVVVIVLEKCRQITVQIRIGIDTDYRCLYIRMQKTVAY